MLTLVYPKFSGASLGCGFVVRRSIRTLRGSLYKPAVGGSNSLLESVSDLYFAVSRRGVDES